MNKTLISVHMSAVTSLSKVSAMQRKGRTSQVWMKHREQLRNTAKPINDTLSEYRKRRHSDSPKAPVASMATPFSRLVRPVRCGRGDTIVEVMICLVVLSMVMATVYAIGGRSSRAGVEARQRTEALSLAQSQVELLINAKNSDPAFAASYQVDQSYCIKSDGTKDSAAQANTDKLCHSYDGTGYNVGITYASKASLAGVFTVTAQWPSADSPGGIASLNLYYKLPGVYKKALVVATSSSVSGTTITMNGTLNPNGNAITNCYFQYDTNASYSAPGQVGCASFPASGSVGGSASASISAIGLSPNTIYFFRLCATNLVGTACSDNSGNFTTPAAPSASTTQITSADYNSSSATIRGNVDGNGNPITDCHFDYGSTTNYGQTISCQGAASGSVQAVIATAAGNTYHYRVVASNAVGTARGSDATFSIPLPPRIDNFYAQPSSLPYGGSTTLYWASSNTASCYSPNIPGGPWFGTGGSKSTGTLTTDTTYQLSCFSPGGVPTGYSNAPVYVAGAPAVATFSASSFVYGGTTTLSWSSTNATACYSPTFGWTGTSSSWTSGPLYGDTTYQIMCTNDAGRSSGYASVTARMTSGAPTVSFSASPTTVPYGGSSTLSWSSTSASGCYSHAFGRLAISGSIPVGPFTSSGDNTYDMACYNDAGVWTAYAYATVTVAGAPSVSYFYANPASITYGGSTTLYWSSSNTSGCLIDNVAWVGTSGSYPVSPSTTTTYSFACYNTAGVWIGRAYYSVSVSNPLPPPPTVSLTAAPTQMGLQFNSTGPISGKTCLQIYEAADFSGTWYDNYQCWPTNQNLSLWWTSAGPVDAGLTTINGLTCVQTRESADPDTWYDNYLCAPRDYGFRWNSAGEIPGMFCTQWYEGADLAHTWYDNYLCEPINSTVNLSWTSSGATSCSSSWGGGGTGTTGSDLQFGLISTTTFTVTCSGPGGNAPDSKTVNVGWIRPY